MCLILYGSATGNAADLADALYDQLRRRKLDAIVCKPFGESSIAELKLHKHVFVICATTGQGALPPQTQPFWTQSLLKRSLQAPVLSSVKLYSFGLGSSAYPKFNWATRKIHARLVQLGAQPAVARGEGDDLGAEPYEAVFDQWMAMALSELDSDLQIIDVLAPTELLPPINPIELLNHSEVSNSNEPLNGSGELTSKIDNLKIDNLDKNSKTKANATVRVNKRITSTEHFQDVRHLVIDLDEKTVYEPGDVVRLYPSNDEDTVNEVLQCQNWSPQQLVRIPTGESITLHELFLNHVDLNAIPRRKFFALCQHFCSKPTQQERMQEFSADLDDLFNYTSRPRRSIAEVVLEFDSLQIPVEYILDVFPPLRSRQFSIASRPSSNNSAETRSSQTNGAETSVELCVAIVKYRTVLRRIRRGLCTRWIEQKALPGTRIRVSFESNNMRLAQKSEHRPVILVATGTGIAPIRSWMQDTSTAPWLFFGCRNERDFLYKGEFGNAKVITAYSQPLDSASNKRYVQDAIRKHATELPIAEALIFVCGSSGPMPKSVREAFVECLKKQGHNDSDAEQIMLAKEKAGYYFQETW